MFTSIRANHFLRRELRHTTESAGINWSFIVLRVIPLSFLTLVALIPTQYYIDDSRVDWLPLIAIILFIPRPILAIRTIFVGIQSVRHDMVQGRWEPLILTGIPARRIVRRKWVQVVLQTFPDQILFSLPSIGLALGISQFFHSTSYNCGVGQQMMSTFYPIQIINLLFRSYCYYGSQIYFAGQLNPSGTVLVIGILIIIVMAFIENTLNSSIGLVVGFSRLAAKGVGIFFGSTIRFTLLLIIFLSIVLMQDNLRYNLNCGNFIIIRINICPNYMQGYSNDILRSLYRTYDTIQLGIMPLLDQGTLLAANVMRPNDDRWLEFKLDYKQPRLTYVRKNHYDNRPFVLRNLIAVMISTFLYWALIHHFLRRATRLAVVNHGASGYLEL